MMRLGGIESLELLLGGGDDCAIGYIPYSTMSNVVKASCKKSFSAPVEGKIYPYLNDETLIQETSVLRAIRKTSARKIFMAGVPPQKAIKKAADFNLTLLSEPQELSAKWEHKIRFHEFCVKHSLPVPNGQTIHSKKTAFKLKTPAVIQEPESASGWGTYFANTKEDVEALLETQKNFPVLAREFADGLPCGITILIDRSGRFAFSAVRAQCSLKVEQNILYHGIQWIPSVDLPTKALERSLIKMAEALHEEGFYGIAGIDFILKDDQIWFLEINPRLSGATWQIAAVPELFPFPFVDSYIKVITGKSLPHSVKRLPRSRYRGSTFDLDAFLFEIQKQKRSVRSSREAAGIYSLSGSHLSLHSFNVKTWKKGLYFVIPGVPTGWKNRKDGWLGVLVSHTPLYNLSKNIIAFSPEGKRIRNATRRIIS